MNVAILIDAENVLPASADGIFEEAASRGEIVSKEIYGAAQALTAWVSPVLKYAMHTNLTIKAAKGKNSSDIALVIGAMDLLLNRSVDTVIIASSDSDFSALSLRLRSAGIEVIGVGTEKSNELWRTACSSFVVLAQPGKKPQHAPTSRQQGATARQSASAARQQPARHTTPEKQPEKQPEKSVEKQPEKPADKQSDTSRVAGTHQERTAIIRQLIVEQIEAAGGRMLTNALFTALNALPEYKVDQQRSGRRPLNYLTRQFGEEFRFWDEDGQGWISLADNAQTGAADSAQEPVQETTPAQALQSPETPPQPDPLALLLEAGLEEDVARKIVQIFTESSGRRDAYNRLRSIFGTTEGRRYYQIVKEIAARQ